MRARRCLTKRRLEHSKADLLRIVRIRKVEQYRRPNRPLPQPAHEPVTGASGYGTSRKNAERPLKRGAADLPKAPAISWDDPKLPFALVSRAGCFEWVACTERLELGSRVALTGASTACDKGPPEGPKRRSDGEALGLGHQIVKPACHLLSAMPRPWAARARPYRTKKSTQGNGSGRAYSSSVVL